MVKPSNTITDWSYLIETIRQGECIILLGPEIPMTLNGVSFWRAFVSSLEIETNSQIASYYDAEELFLFSDAIAKSRVYYQMKSFYEQEPKSLYYDQISRLPLKLILNANSDRFLCDRIGEGNYNFEFFHKSDPNDIVPIPKIEKPLIYNLIGSLEEEESLILTHDDLFGYLEAVLAQQQLPSIIIDEIFNARSLIFLGFRFDRWYVQLLLRLLKVHDARSRFARYATQQKYNADILSICEDQFKIEFVGAKAGDFLNELYKRCEAEGLLIERSPNENSFLEEIKLNLSKNKLIKALEILKDQIELKADEDIANEVIGLSARLNRLEKRKRQNVITQEQSQVESSRIREDILALMSEL